MLIDSHCHLNYPGLAERQGEVLANARAGGVGGMLNISTRESEWDSVLAVAEQAGDVWASIGIHPHEADAHEAVSTAKLIERAAHPRVVAIGETGLDFYYDKSDRARQEASFRRHIAAARATGLPVIVHTRDAEDRTLAILSEEMAAGAFSGVIHCFTASAAFGAAALELGLYISMSGILTFRNAADLRAAAAEFPLDRLLVETDAPFLAPVPFRGKTAEPAHVAQTAACLADIKGVALAEVAAATTANFFRLFGKAALAGVNAHA